MPYSEAYFRSAGVGQTMNLSITDDDAVSFEPTYFDTVLLVWTDDGAEAAIVMAGTHSDGAVGTALNSTANAVASTGSKVGTDGTDGQLAISPHTDGMVYIENRLGGTKNVRVREIN